MTQRVGTIAALLALAAVATGMLLQADRSGPDAAAAGPDERSAVVLVLELPSGPLIAAVASGGGRAPSAIAIPAAVTLTIPGQGVGNAGEAALLPGPAAVTAISNLLGVWVPHYAFTDGRHLAAAVDRAGGIDVFGERLDGRGVLGALGAAGRLATWREVLRSVLSSVGTWRVTDLTQSDDGVGATHTLRAAAGVEVGSLPTSRASGGLMQIDGGATASVVADEFGGSGSEPVPVIVLNGNGAPGVGQAAAEALIPAGFRIVASGNASSFGHRVTLVVASAPEDQALAERAQEALGVGRVSEAGAPSGLADVTIVLGKDFEQG